MKNFIKLIIATAVIFCGVTYLEGEKNEEYLKGSYNQDQATSSTLENNNKNITELVLVNKQIGLDKNYIPEGLTVPNIDFVSDSDDEEKQVAGIVIKPLEELVNAASNEGITIIGNSAYRSYKSQKKVYNDRVKSEGRESADAYVAKPGFSEHQTGLCIDVTNPSRYFVQGTIEADWIEKNCYKFGFIVRYPYGKRSITGIEHEPWHIRYVGKDAAKYIYNNGITLEEYLGY